MMAGVQRNSGCRSGARLRSHSDCTERHKIMRIWIDRKNSYEGFQLFIRVSGALSRLTPKVYHRFHNGFNFQNGVKDSRQITRVAMTSLLIIDK